MSHTSRLAGPADAAAIALIYNEGIVDGVATFETAMRRPQDVEAWFETPYPVVLVEGAPIADGSPAAEAALVEGGTRVVAFATTSPYRPRACYRHIAEFSVYVARQERGHGHGETAMRALFVAARAAGLGKLVSRVFIENVPSRNLLARLGFREVGVYERHGRLDGRWRDVVIVERQLDED